MTMQGPENSPGTPYMDGVPFLTQCPIPPDTYFRYSFYVPDAGTYYYHSHAEFQRGDGLYGGIIVRQPPGEDPNYNTYDFDLPQHTILVQDWMHKPTIEKFIHMAYGNGSESPESMLVNGRGPYQNDNDSSIEASIPYTRFKVMSGSRYRMRVISNAILSCPITVAVDQHLLTLIASDGWPIIPITVKSFVIYTGEKWDFVLQADHKKSGAFWMSFMGGLDCENLRAHQFALLVYDEQDDVDDLTLPSNMPPKPEYTVVPPPG
ncbi:hypothetical protein OTU49_013595, partial [Cherax quadricarinatus]